LIPSQRIKTWAKAAESGDVVSRVLAKTAMRLWPSQQRDDCDVYSSQSEGDEVYNCGSYVVRDIGYVGAGAQIVRSKSDHELCTGSQDFQQTLLSESSGAKRENQFTASY
jgi:hypothetical protein